MNFEALRNDAAYSGWPRVLFARALKRFQLYLGLHLFRVNIRPLPAQPADPAPPEGITVCVLGLEELLKATADPELDLDPDFVRMTLAQGDLVCGAYDGGRLVGYAWRTSVAAPFYKGLWVKVGHRYHYAYRHFVLPSHRGRYINASLVRLADRESRRRGCVAEVDLAPIGNLASRGAGDSVGRRRVGYAGYLSLFGSSLAFRTPGAREPGVVIFRPRARIPIGLVPARS